MATPLRKRDCKHLFIKNTEYKNLSRTQNFVQNFKNYEDIITHLISTYKLTLFCFAQVKLA